MASKHDKKRFCGKLLCSRGGDTLQAIERKGGGRKNHGAGEYHTPGTGDCSTCPWSGWRWARSAALLLSPFATEVGELVPCGACPQVDAWQRYTAHHAPAECRRAPV